MPQAEYIGTAARYCIGKHVFNKDDPASLVQPVDETIATFLKENPSFRIDGEAGVKTKADEDAPEDKPIIPADGFKSRDEAKAFAAKWLPGFELDMTRSTAELQRRVEAELHGKKVDNEGEVVAPNAAVIPQVEKKAAPPKQKVTV